MYRLVGLVSCALCGFVALWAIGQWYRDNYWLTGLLFYIPTPIVVATCILVFFVAAWQHRWQVTLATTVLAAAPFWMLGWVENRLFDTPHIENQHEATYPATRKLTLVHWNINGAKPRGSSSGVRHQLRDIDADIFVLSDAPWITRQLTLSNMSTLQLGSMAIYAVGEVRLLEDLSKGPLKSYLVRWQSPDGELTILLGDITSSLAVHRAPYLSTLTQYLHSYQADLLVGDLNAPRRSMALTKLQPGYRHAYEEVGRGWSYSWPWPIPVYAIDNCIVGPKIYANSYQLISSRHSDHKIQRLRFSVNNS